MEYGLEPKKKMTCEEASYSSTAPSSPAIIRHGVVRENIKSPMTLSMKAHRLCASAFIPDMGSSTLHVTANVAVNLRSFCAKMGNKALLRSCRGTIPETT